MASSSSGHNNKKNIFGEDEDTDTTSLFVNPGMFPIDRNLGALGPSPHQFNALGMYAQGVALAAGSQPSLVAAAASQNAQAAAAGRALGRQVSQPALSSNQTGFALGSVMAPQPPLSSSPSKQMFGMSNRAMYQHNMRKTPPFAGLGGLFGPGPAGSRSSGDLLQDRFNESNFETGDFPLLSGHSNSQHAGPLSLNRNFVSLMSKVNQEPAAEFKMTQEDFPALPGTQNPTSSSGDTTRSRDIACAAEQTGTPGSVDGSTRDGVARFPGDTNTANLNPGPVGQRKGITTGASNMVSNIPDSMLADRFGIAGLLSFIRGAEQDPGICALAPGVDLTTLGLNLNSTEPLHQTFQSPWADQPCRPQDIDFHVPSEYQTNIFIRDKLAQIKLNRYSDDVLFFLFYFFTGDCLQLLAAAELYNRDWRYHKDEKVWVTRPAQSEPKYRTKAGENGTYVVFDRSSWSKMRREMYLEYEKLEERPTLPGTIRSLVAPPAQLS